MTRPGIYLRGDIDYDSINAVNYSTLKHLAKSPLQYQHVLKSGVAENVAMGKGTATHCAVLEPGLLVERYAIYQGKRRAGKDWEAFEAAAEGAGKRILKQSELDEVYAMRDAVRGHKVADSYLSNGHAEVALVWVDVDTGILCKARLDYLRDDNTATDLKTTASIEAYLFGKVCARLMYHVQAAFYSDGLATITNKPVRFAVVAVEQKPPHDVVPYLAGEDRVIIPGRKEYKRLLSKLKECRESNEWPGYSGGGEMDLALPAYVSDGEDEELELSIGGESFHM